jgi:glycosyltransferase domain-containing protein
VLGRLVKDLLRRGPTVQGESPGTAVGQATPAPAGPAPKKVVDVSTPDEKAPDLWLREHSPLVDLTIIVPYLPGRVRFLETLMAHFAASRILCPVIMTVNSDAPREPEVERIVAAHAELNVRVLYHPMAVHFVDRLIACAREATTKYVFVHSDDDVVVAGALADCVDFLNAHDDYVACEGRSFFFSIKGTQLVPQAQRFLTRDEGHGAQRVLEHCQRYTNTFHAVTRREAFVASNEQTMAHTRQVIYWQYLSSCWLIALGKLKVLDRLYYMRLDNPGGERAQLVKRADRSHWPYLIVAPNFSEEQERFKVGLMAALTGQAPSEQLAVVVDECCLGLIRRAFGGPLKYDASELEMQARFFDSTSHEAALARYCGPRSIECLASLAPPQPALAEVQSG